MNRKVQPQPDRTRIQVLHQVRVIFQLRLVTDLFIVQKCFQPPALMSASFVVDDPPDVLIVNECAIEDEMADTPIDDTSQGVFPFIFLMPAKNP